MKILITGVCGFVGSTLARAFSDAASAGGAPMSIVGLDNFSRPGSEANRHELQRRSVKLFSGDLRCAPDVESLPDVDWVIDCAANPSVLAGVDGKASSRQVVDHNLVSTINLLEFCKARRAGFMLLSTSRVYSVKELAGLPMLEKSDSFALDIGRKLPPGVSDNGVAEGFSVEAPVSLYGATKLTSELMALEYGETFGLPIWINRCGVLAGAGQFGRADQGIFAYWINSYLRRKPLRYIGFGGRGFQCRDCFHPRDLVPLLMKQFNHSGGADRRVFNLGGGPERTMSLRELSLWCERRFGTHLVQTDPLPRRFDIPWMVMDGARAQRAWDWQPESSLESILDEIAKHAEQHEHWLEVSANS